MGPWDGTHDVSWASGCFWSVGTCQGSLTPPDPDPAPGSGSGGAVTAGSNLDPDPDPEPAPDPAPEPDPAPAGDMDKNQACILGTVELASLIRPH